MAPADGNSLVTPPSDAASARTFHIRTYGCQMNEHDSERLAGLLIADGLVATDDLESADVVVLNTCCIRENADNKFYGHLGNLKSLRESRPDMQIAVGGCLAQMDREHIQPAGRPRGRGLRHPQPGACTRPAAPGGRLGPADGDPRRAAARGRSGHGRIECRGPEPPCGTFPMRRG